MTSNPDRCALGRQLLDRVVDAQLGLQCGGSAARDELARAREDSPASRRRGYCGLRSYDR